MLFPPTSEDDPAYWAAVAAGHVFVGAVAAALVVGLFGWPAWAAPVVYLIAWEIVRQRVGAGWLDALVDTAFVALGAAMIWCAWHQQAVPMFGAMVAALAGIGVGIRRRM